MKGLVIVTALLLPGVAAAEKSFTGDKAIAWDCGEDPEVSISTDDATVTLKGACTEIATSGTNLKVTIERIGELVVNGDGNTFTIGTLGAVTINGNKNKVTYKKPVKGRAAGVQNNGKKNAVVKAKK